MAGVKEFDQKCKEELNLGRYTYQYYSLSGLQDIRVNQLTYSTRVLLESALRNCDEFNAKTENIHNILEWVKTSQRAVYIPFKPARVLLKIS